MQKILKNTMKTVFAAAVFFDIVLVMRGKRRKGGFAFGAGKFCCRRNCHL